MKIIIFALIPLILSIGLAPALPFIDAFESSIVCNNDQILVQRSTNEKFACVNYDTAQKWVKSGFATSLDKQLKEESSFEIIPTANGQTLQKPNIIVIMGDDVGWLNIGAYHRGLMKHTTPNIDQMASDGMIFTDYYADPSCTAGRASFAMGQLPIRVGLTTVGQAGVDHGIPDGAPTIGTIFQSMDYATGQFGKNHFGDLNKYLPTVHGFDEFYGYLYHLNAMEDPHQVNYPDELNTIFGPRNILHTWASDVDDSTVDDRWGKVGKQIIEDDGALPPERMKNIDREILGHATNFMDEALKDDKSFFVWLNPSRVHTNTHLNDYYEGLRNSENGWSVSEAAHKEFDDTVGAVLEYLDKNNLTDNTIVIVTADNGAESWTWPDGAQTPFADSKGSFMEGGMRVPLIMKWPGHIPTGIVENGIMSHLDMLPTLVAAAGNPNIVKELKEGKTINGEYYKVHLDGYNQIPMITGEDESNRNEIYYFAGTKFAAVRVDDYKYRFLDWPDGLFGSTVTLNLPSIVNLRLDPLEKTRVAWENTDASSSSFQAFEWYFAESWRFVVAQDQMTKLAKTFVEFPPLQGSASFDVKDAMEKAKNVSEMHK